jgi:hypothetical protein
VHHAPPINPYWRQYAFKIHEGQSGLSNESFLIQLLDSVGIVQPAGYPAAYPPLQKWNISSTSYVVDRPLQVLTESTAPLPADPMVCGL